MSEICKPKKSELPNPKKALVKIHRKSIYAISPKTQYADYVTSRYNYRPKRQRKAPKSTKPNTQAPSISTFLLRDTSDNTPSILFEKARQAEMIKRIKCAFESQGLNLDISESLLFGPMDYSVPIPKIEENVKKERKRTKIFKIPPIQRTSSGFIDLYTKPPLNAHVSNNQDEEEYVAPKYIRHRIDSRWTKSQSDFVKEQIQRECNPLMDIPKKNRDEKTKPVPFKGLYQPSWEQAAFRSSKYKKYESMSKVSAIG
jgi:hypothetical protein